MRKNICFVSLKAKERVFQKGRRNQQCQMPLHRVKWDEEQNVCCFCGHMSLVALGSAVLMDYWI